MRRSLLVLTFAAASLALTATPASAFPPSHSYAAQITGFNNASGLAVDSADNVWISDGTGLFEYGPYPSLTQVGQQTGGPAGSSLAVNSINGDLYDAVSNALESNLYVFQNGTGPLLTTIGIGSLGTYSLRVATDNSSPATGRVYVSDGSSVQAFDANHNPLDFSASASYISANQITGTPSGPFGLVGNISTDNQGNIYVDDRNNLVVDEFDSTGAFVQAFTGADAPGGFTDAGGQSVAVDPTNGHVLIADYGQGVIDEFDSTGAYLNQITGTSGSSPFGTDSVDTVAFNSSGDLYVSLAYQGVVDIFTPNPVFYPIFSYRPISNLVRDSVTLNASVAPNGGGDITDCHFEYGTDTSYSSSAQCLDSANNPIGTSANPITTATDVHADLSKTLSSNTTYHYRLVLTNASGTLDVADRQFETPPAVTDLQTGSATDITNVSATLNGSYTGDGYDTSYYFEYGTSTAYGHFSTPPPGTDNGSVPSGTQNVSDPIAGLASSKTYHYRIVATNKFGTTVGADQTFATDQAPTIDSFSTSNVTATSADLNAQINPQGFDTTYHFEYGTSTSYGTTTPDTDAGSAGSDQSVSFHLSGLQGVVYHFRVVATNKWGTVTSADQTFEFFPPSCPNSAVRQQTGSAYLPDCRAYELVSPSNANGTLLFPGGPNTGQATSPSRFSFTGAFSSLPGTNTINTAGDLYVATRTDGGWASKYIGLPGDQAGCMGGPPNDPRSEQVFLAPAALTNTVLTDPAMSRFLIWLDGTPVPCFVSNIFFDQNWAVAPASNAPYMYNADGTLAQRLPAGLGSAPAGLDALKCPFPEANFSPPICASDVTASADLSHLAFSSNNLAFAPGGLTAAPGSAYDNDVAANTVTLISKLANGDPIPQDPSFATAPPFYINNGGLAVAWGGGKGEYIRFPAVSADGSHILMSTATATTPPCVGGAGTRPPPCKRFTDFPLHLYMRVGGGLGVTYDIAQGHAVNYVGMTPDGSKVYFTTDQQLTADDHDTSTDLYMWSEATNSLTRLSAAGNGAAAGAGDSDACNATWTAQCGVVPYSGWSYSWLPGGSGGNGVSDSAIASANGDIYFYSPEQLDGDKGALGQQNLYVYRGGKVQFVTTFDPGSHCTDWSGQGDFVCSDGPIVRLNVSPDDSHMALVTDNRLTSYDNAGYLEMYSYTPSTGAIVCDSCRPDGQPPSADVQASEDGLFMTDNGRTFFSTTDPLVPQDTNRSIDVYEFVDGRPQLITPGTGKPTRVNANGYALQEIPGLVGVSADGTDVYFSTFDSLISEDHNGSFYKFYDARSGGGFAQPTPVPPCAAAEECHGPGSSAPALPTQGTAAGLSGGNATPNSHPRHHHKKHHKRAHKRHHTRTNRRTAR